MVHIPIVGFDEGSEIERELDGQRINAINPTNSVDVTGATKLTKQLGTAFMGDTKEGRSTSPKP